MFQLQTFKASSVFKRRSFAPLFISAFSTVLGRYSAMVTKRKKLPTKKNAAAKIIKGIKINDFRELILKSASYQNCYLRLELYLKKKNYSITEVKHAKDFFHNRTELKK